MSITNQQRNAAYEVASETNKFLYASPESGEALWKIAEKYNLTDDTNYNKFILVVGDMILDLSKPVELPSILSQNLGLSTAMSTVVSTEINNALEILTTQAEIYNSSEDAAMALDIAEAEASLSNLPNIPHVRTMANDVELQQAQSHIPTYTSTQSAILNEGRTKPEASAPSWGQ